ncbi:MAG: hypothetical protein A2649_01685 [Candidatus Yanofskybacteria bacterium RIFCSPHIGHO2_01_FULL_41_26]|uniref:Fe2OG dioxygenase domain-containing protein n=1 Tax=Candidatus Yanofskybacteria bacterium RIFCSPHIGHO2_01_FULL_41_26 TaxID=1802661 RepID=A0A1F8EE94_9BACT|nr:MAG: hypothetical protein A2649_01685 [Candidatus Yanofskybacteria bacterium RIFCSPHIGHO2_01_FULL_41_26]
MVLNQWLTEKYLNPETRQNLRRQFLQNRPFPHLQLSHFLQEEKVRELLAALQNEPFLRKDSDLFTFFQTADLKNTKNKIVREFYQLLASAEFTTLLSDLAGVKLQPKKVDISATLYANTHHLLPHDDRLENRRIAFMYYLSTLKKKDGGALCFYQQKKNQPTTVTKRLPPVFNTFTFFLVSQHSFHQVEEVRTDTPRLALGGWFYDQ